MKNGHRPGLCAGILREGESCSRTNGRTCPVVAVYGDTLAACIAQEKSSALHDLSPREREVHLLLIKGKTNKMIAVDLDISERTVEFHRANIMRKMNAASLAELIERTMAAWSTR